MSTRRRTPWTHTWDEDGVQRQAQVHYTRNDRSVVWAPRWVGDYEPWLDGDFPSESSEGRYQDEDIATLGDPNAPGYGLTDPDEDLDDEDEPPPPSGEATSTDRGPHPTSPGPHEPNTKEEMAVAITKIPDATTHKALLAALANIRMELESRQEDLQNATKWSQEAADRVVGMAEEIKALNVDNITIGNVLAVGDAATGQASAAATYASRVDNSVTQAENASRTAYRNHHRIDEAVNDAPVAPAKPSFYDAE